MEELNLLKHSTYNVEQIKKNREFFSSLLSQIERTYATYSKRERDYNNRKDVEFAPAPSPRITNVFMSIDVNGVIKIVFNGVRTKDDKKMNLLKKKYDSFTYSSGSTSITIDGVTAENYTSHLPSIVLCIESVDYSFR